MPRGQRYEGAPCREGHTLRYVSNGSCVECRRIYALAQKDFCQCGAPKKSSSEGCVSCRTEARLGENNPWWKGGRRVSPQGYVLVWSRGHPSRPKKQSSYVPEQRLVMEEHLGRYLTKFESVHHINGVKDDNRVENLQLRVRNHGYGQAYSCLDCGSSNIVPAKLAGDFNPNLKS